MLRFVLAVFMGFVAALAGSAHALAYNVSDSLREKLAEIGCGDPLEGDGSDGEPSLAHVLAMLSPWSPKLHQQVQEDLATDRSLPRSDWQHLKSQAAYAEKVIAGEERATPTAVRIAARRLVPVEARVLADARTHGRAVCDIMWVQRAVNPKEIDRLRRAKPGKALPYTAIGQALMTAAGCDAGSLDGSIGRKSIAAWARLVPGARLDKRIAEGPGWLLQLYSKRVGTPSCSPSGLRETGVGIALAAVGELFAAHRVVLLRGVSDVLQQEMAINARKLTCAPYRHALAKYATGVMRSPPDAAQRPWLEKALRGLKTTLTCLDGADEAAIGTMLVGQGLHADLLAAAPPRAKYGLALLLLLPAYGQPDHADRAVGLLRDAFAASLKPNADISSVPDQDRQADHIPHKAAALLAWAYESGIGVAPNAQEAKRWQALAQRHAPGRESYPWRANPEGTAYASSLSPAALHAHVDWLMARSGLVKGRGTDDARVLMPAARPDGLPVDGPQLLFIDTSVIGEILPDVAELADIYVRHTSVRAPVARKATPLGKFVLATVLIEGHGTSGRQLQLGGALMRNAADEGVSAAMVRTAHAYEFGLGVPVDMALARSYYERAAAAGQTLGYLALARIYDNGEHVPQDLALADSYYRAALAPLLKALPRRPEDGPAEDPLGDRWFEERDPTPAPATAVLADGLRRQMMMPSSYFRGPLGAKLLSELVTATPMTATQIGKWYLCADCGSPVKPAEAVLWLRRAVNAGSWHSAYVLARLVLEFPELASVPNEGKSLLKRVAGSESAQALEAELLLATLESVPLPPPDELKRRLRAQCSVVKDGVTSEVETCIDISYRLAIGAVSPSLVKVGYEALREWAQTNVADPAGRSRVRRAQSALIDVLSLYGNFREALGVLRGSDSIAFKSSWYDPQPQYSARNQTFSRLILAIAESKGRNLSADFEALLAALAGRGDLDAAAFRQLLAERRDGKVITAPLPSVDTARDVLKVQLDRGGFSHGVVVASRELSEALASAGEKGEALAYELVALNASMEINRAASVESGPLPSRLVAACQLARSSERVKKLGFTEVATVLAKEAVNRLQEVRHALTGLPQNFRTCFADLTEDQYRPLIGLLADQDRPGTAQAVLQMLKDSERLDYAGLDEAYVHRAFDKLPMAQLELDVLSRALSVKPIVTPRTERFALLKQRRKSGALTVEEEREMEALESEIFLHNTSFGSLKTDLLAAVALLNDPIRRRTNEEKRIDHLDQLKGELRRVYAGKAAVLHFVVLPDRMYGILTTGSGHKSYTWRKLGDAPFTEMALNAKIDDLRWAIENRLPNVQIFGEELYRVLLVQSSFDRELAAAGTEVLLLSPDRRLRYVPFGALRSAKGWLAEKYAVAMLPEAVGSNLGAPVPSDAPRISAFAMSEAVDGFKALPHAAEEVRAIVKVEDRPGALGIFLGRASINRDFTLQAFQDALVGPQGASAGTIVHVSSHFKLGASDADSFLLLGTGKRLLVKEIRERRTVYDFGDVDLLTLSACSTAYVGATPGDGRDLESFAAVVRKTGARAVLATLWPVADKSTAALMERFYRLQADKKMPRAVALATAQREFIQSGEKGRMEPFHWAPFVLIGNWQ